MNRDIKVIVWHGHMTIIAHCELRIANLFKNAIMPSLFSMLVRVDCRGY